MKKKDQDEKQGSKTSRRMRGKRRYSKPSITEEQVLKFSSLGTPPPGGLPTC
jgi:hypothetical protein